MGIAKYLEDNQKIAEERMTEKQDTEIVVVKKATNINHKLKKQFKTKIYRLLRDYKNGNEWKEDDCCALCHLRALVLWPLSHRQTRRGNRVFVPNRQANDVSKSKMKCIDRSTALHIECLTVSTPTGKKEKREGYKYG